MNNNLYYLLIDSNQKQSVDTVNKCLEHFSHHWLKREPNYQEYEFLHSFCHHGIYAFLKGHIDSLRIVQDNLVINNISSLIVPEIEYFELLEIHKLNFANHNSLKAKFGNENLILNPNIQHLEFDHDISEYKVNYL